MFVWFTRKCSSSKNPISRLIPELYEFREGSIFGGRPLSDILATHSQLDFFHKWLEEIHHIYDLEDMTLDDWTQYFQFKAEINEKPNDDVLIKQIAAKSKKFVYRLVRDFLDELPEPFITKRTTNVMEEFCKYCCRQIILLLFDSNDSIWDTFTHCRQRRSK